MAFARILGGLAAAARRFPRLHPERGISTDDWLRSLRVGRRTMGLVQNMIGTLFGVEPVDAEAAFSFDYLTKPGSSGVSAHPEGSIGPRRALTEHYLRTGDELRLESDADGKARAAEISCGGTVVVEADVVVSSVGPLLTVARCGDAAPSDWAAQVRTESTPTSLITINFGSRTPMPKFDGMFLFTGSRRLARLRVLRGSPSRRRSVRRRCRDRAPQVRSAREPPAVRCRPDPLVEVCSGSTRWPAQWSVAGRSLPNTTPIPNLWNVGDGVYEWATTGQSGCVETARHVVEQIRREFPRATRSIQERT